MRPAKQTQQPVPCPTATYWKWREGKVRPIPGNSPNDRVTTRTGFSIVPRGFATMPSAPLFRGAIEHAAAPLRFQGMAESIGPMFSQAKTKTYKPGGRVPPPVGRPPAPVQGRDGRSAPYPSSAMSSGRLFLDRVARQHCPSPVHRQHEPNTRPAELWEKVDISTLRKGGHFYFALTSRYLRSRAQPGGLARLPIIAGQSADDKSVCVLALLQEAGGFRHWTACWPTCRPTEPST